MAQWQIINSNKSAENFVDGQTALPGEEGFSTDEVVAQAKGRSFNYLGQSPDFVDAPADEPSADPATL